MLRYGRAKLGLWKKIPKNGWSIGKSGFFNPFFGLLKEAAVAHFKWEGGAADFYCFIAHPADHQLHQLVVQLGAYLPSICI